MAHNTGNRTIASKIIVVQFRVNILHCIPTLTRAGRLDLGLQGTHLKWYHGRLDGPLRAYPLDPGICG